MGKYKDFSKKQYNQVAGLKDGDVFVCRTKGYDNPFESWDYAVAKKEDGKVNVFGLFKTTGFASMFAKQL